MSQEKRVLITGGAVRVGAQIVRTLAEAGWSCVIHYCSSKQEARELRQEIRNEGGKCNMISADFQKMSEVKDVIPETTAQFGPLDAIINNASVFYSDSFPNTTEQTWDTTMNVNLKAPFLLSRAFYREFEGEAGQIVNVLDWRATHPGTDHFSYTISRGALATLTEVLAQQLPPVVRVNAVLPGPVLPPEGSSEEVKKDIVRDVPMEKWGSPEDVANAIQFLLDGSTFINGEFLYLDGGRRYRGDGIRSS